MKKILLSVFTLLLAIGIMLLDSPEVLTYSSGNIPGDRTGAPGSSNGGCGSSSCHGSSSLNGSGSAEITIDTEAYEPGETYLVTVTTNDNEGASLFGFQATVLAGAENEVDANTDSPDTGGFIAPGGMNTKIESGRSYIMHQNTSNSTGSWFFNWEAPAEDIGPVTFYVAALAANGNGGKTGDFVFFNSMELSSASETECLEFGDVLVPVAPLCHDQPFTDLGIAFPATLPEGVSNVYYYYDEDPDFDPYALEGTYLQSGFAGYNLPNNSCDPIDYTVKAALILHEGGMVTDGPPTEEDCLPQATLGTVTVYPEVQSPLIDNQECSVTVTAFCDGHTVNGQLNSATIELEAGQTNQQLTFTVSNGLISCDTPVVLTGNCPDPTCPANGGQLEDPGAFNCAGEPFQVNTNGANLDDEYDLLYLITDPNLTIIEINESGSFDPGAGIFIPHTMSVPAQEIEGIPAETFVGWDANDLVDFFVCFDLQTFAGFTTVVGDILVTSEESCDEMTGEVSLLVSATGGTPAADDASFYTIISGDDIHIVEGGESANILIGAPGTDYSVTVFDETTCNSNSIDGTASDCMTGLTEATESDLSLRVYTAAGNINFEITTAFSSDFNLSLLSASGQLMHSETEFVSTGITNKSWSLDLPSGIYLLRAENGKQQSVYRFFVD